MTIQISGIDELFRKFDAIQAITRLKPPMRSASVRLYNRMTHYPPPPPGSKHRRTGRLGRDWRIDTPQEFPNGITGKVYNDDTPYVRYVQAASQQAAIHRGRWQTEQQVIEQERAAIVADFEKAIADALR